MTTANMKKSRILYIAATILCIVFAFIYEQFSHGVMSESMMLAFLIPLSGGGLAEASGRLLRSRIRRNRIRLRNANRYSQFLAGSAIWFTLGALYAGVLEIYGTTNRLSIYYWIVGGVLCAAAIFTYVVSLRKVEFTSVDDPETVPEKYV